MSVTISFASKEDFDKLLAEMQEVKEMLKAIYEPQKPKIYMFNEVALMLKISRNTLKTMMEKGVIEGKKDGNRIYFTASEVDRYINQPRKK